MDPTPEAAKRTPTPEAAKRTPTPEAANDYCCAGHGHPQPRGWRVG